MRELSKLITIVENDPLRGREIVSRLEKREDVNVIGITGNPGVGKSSLVDRLTGCYRKRGKSVAIIAVDPSSPFTGGSFLGDRIRMKRHFTDEGVFIRSMASRGSLGGINDAVFDVVELMKAFDFDIVLIETVGAGQSEVEIAYVADTVLLVLSPGGGDEIQLLKAGIVEIADVFVINKSDLPGADALEISIKAMLELSEHTGWIPPVVRTVATTGEGVEELCDVVESHRRYLLKSKEITNRRIRRMKKHAQHILMNKLMRIMEDLNVGDLDLLVKETLREMCKEVKE